MLSLETCKALATRHPEVWERPVGLGDVFWPDAPKSRPTLWNDKRRYLSDAPRLIWCPRLGDLLEIAKATAMAEERSLRLELGTSSWTFGYADYEDIQWPYGSGDTPETSVAAWLLAR